jgi:hypothetical protein
MNQDDRNEKGGVHRSRALVLGAGGPSEELGNLA